MGVFAQYLPEGKSGMILYVLYFIHTLYTSCKKVLLRYKVVGYQNIKKSAKKRRKRPKIDIIIAQHHNTIIILNCFFLFSSSSSFIPPRA